MSSKLVYTLLASPIGPLMLTVVEERLTGLYMNLHKGGPQPQADWKLVERPGSGVLASGCEQLLAYFAGERRDFDLPLEMVGTPFQRRVWQELTRIPNGTTISYGELAARIGQPKASRAVGAANGRNPVSIVVPCHRVIGSSGTLTGYGGGLDNKRWLLDFEREHYGLEGTAGRERDLFSAFEVAADASTVRRSPTIAATSGKS